jgi:hypothetical protein
MKVYRVYRPYYIRYFDDCGTYEYGIFSTLKKATARLMKIYKKERKKNPKYKFEFNPKEGFLRIYDGHESWTYYIEKFNLDEEIEEEFSNYQY